MNLVFVSWTISLFPVFTGDSNRAIFLSLAVHAHDFFPFASLYSTSLPFLSSPFLLL